MARLSLKVSKRILIKTAAIFFSILLLTIALISLYLLRLSRENTMERISEAKMETLQAHSFSVSGKIHVLETTANTIISNQHLWRFVYTSETDESTYSVVREVIQLFDNLRYAEPMIESIYFYDSTHPFVIGDGIFDKEQFFDPALLEPQIAASTLRPPTVINRSTPFTPAPDVNITSYVRELRIANNRGILVINAYTDDLFQTVLHSGEESGITAVTDGARLLYATATIPDGIGLDFPEHTLSAGGEQARSDLGREYMVNRLWDGKTGLCFINLHDQLSLTQTAEIVRRMALPIIVIITLASAALIAISSLFIHYPLLGLLGKIKHYYPDIYSSVKKNEYAIINSTMDALQHSNLQLRQRVELAIPYLKNHSLLEFLINPFFRRSEFFQLIQSLEVAFPHTSHCLLLLETTEAAGRIGDLMEVQLKSCGDRFHYLSCRTGPSQSTFLLNFQGGQEIIEELADTVLALCVEATIPVKLCMGEVFQDLEQLSRQYYACLQTISRDDAGASASVLQAIPAQSQPLPLSAFHKKGDKLVEAVKGQNEGKIEAAIARVFQESGRLAGHVPYLKYLTFHLVFRLTGELMAIGAQPPGGHLDEICRTIEGASTQADLHQILSNYAHQCGLAVQEQGKRLQKGAIQGILAYIQEHYTRDLPLEEIAGVAGLSPNYLSSIFKANTNSTVLEYITALRLALAQELLLETDLQIKTVAARVGYNSVQSFNRLFKQQTGMTPVQYRTREQRDDSAKG